MRDLNRVKTALLNAVAGADFTSAEATDILKSFTQEIMLRTRRSDLPESPVLTATDTMESPLHAAERYLDAAKVEICHSLVDEHFIDCLDNLIQHLKER